MKKLILVSYKSLLMLWLCAIAAGPFLQINHLAQPWVLVAYSLIAVASGMLFALKPRWWPLGVVVLVGNTLGWLWWLFPSAGWLWTFWERFFTALRQFLLVGGLSVPQIVSVPLVFIVIAFLAVLIIGLDHYLIAWIVVFSYLLAVHVFNGNDLLLVFAQMGAVGLAFLGLHRYAEQPRRLLRWLIVTTVLVAGITVLNQNVASLNNALVDQTVSLRNWLNDRGFYQAISAYARQNMRTGLSENDRVLGGPVYDDPTPVVTVTQKTPHYFRAEVKSVYTGTGWQSARQQEMPVEATAPITDADTTYQKAETITMRQAADNTYVVLPYGRVQLTQTQPQSLERLRYNVQEARLMVTRGRTPTRISLQASAKKATATQLAAVSAPKPTASQIQLPKLPARIKRLATRLTATQPTYYQKVKAVETYLNSAPQLTYSKVDAKVTPKNRDYVDYFLFDSRVGYCDNFSSAMVVLLRSVGIPARWAKGYNTGSVTKVNGDGTDVYTLSNADAHSWPEVYFPGFGWLPFEPTPGFSNPSSPTTSTTPPAASSQSRQSSSSTSSSRSQASSSQSSTSSSSRTTKAQQTSGISGWWWLVPIVIGITFLWWLQQRWLGLVALFLSKHVTRTNYEQRYRQLLWLLNREWTREPGETLLAYAKRVDETLQLDGTFSKATRQYEASRFGGEAVTGELHEVARAFDAYQKHH